MIHYEIQTTWENMTNILFLTDSDLRTLHPLTVTTTITHEY